MQPQSKAEKPGTKIRPATALPWREFAPEIAGVVDQGYRYIEGGRGFYAGPDRVEGFSLTGIIDPRDAAYLVHAASAYQKLVEALLAELEIDSRPRTRDEVRSVRERTWALLRDLGEIE